MIYTVTFNPSLDYIVSVKDFKLWNTNRTDTELMLPGGKGLNVSTVLKNLGMDSTALGFTAGFVGDEILRRIENIGFKSDFIKLENGCSRINLKLKNYDGTEINGQGPVIEHAHLEALMKKLDQLEKLEISWCWPAAFPPPCLHLLMKMFWHGCRIEKFSLWWMLQKICSPMY